LLQLSNLNAIACLSQGCKFAEVAETSCNEDNGPHQQLCLVELKPSEVFFHTENCGCQQPKSDGIACFDSFQTFFI